MIETLNMLQFANPGAVPSQISWMAMMLLAGGPGPVGQAGGGCASGWPPTAADARQRAESLVGGGWGWDGGGGRPGCARPPAAALRMRAGTRAGGPGDLGQWRPTTASESRIE